MDNYETLRTTTYPNINEGKIPYKDELTRVLGLINRREQTIAALTPKKEEAVTTIDALRISIKQKEIGLEQDRRKLKDAKMSLERVSNQLGRAQDDLDVLQGDIHPIRRCPTDIMQHIFEIAVESPGVAMMWNRHARNLSQVCYRWRIIALRTPKLWCRIGITVSHRPAHIDELWRQHVDRVGNYPAIVRFKGITNQDSSWRAMRRCCLKHLPRINNLILRFENNAATRRLITEEQSWLSINIKHLVIENDLPEPHLNQMISSLPILYSKMLRNLHTLLLGNFNFKDLTDDRVFPRITTLTVQMCCELRFDLLAKVFPGAIIVNLYHVRRITHSSEIINWPKVASLVVLAEGAGCVPWNWLKLPKIVDMRIYQNNVDDAFKQFIKTHTTILHLDTWFSHIEGIHEDAPQLISYGMAAKRDMDVSVLPKCLNLTLYQDYAADIPCSLFEAIIRTQQTNNVGRTSIGYQDRPSLTILALKENLQDSCPLLWRESKLLNDATEFSSTAERLEVVFESYRFMWK